MSSNSLTEKQMFDLTFKQLALMRHTMQNDRNWFGTDLGCRDSKEFEFLVQKGLAIREVPPAWMGDDVVYILTEAGKQAVKEAA